MPKDVHTLQLRSEREAMEAFGMTRPQAREALLKAAKLHEAERVKKQFDDEELRKRIDRAIADRMQQVQPIEQRLEPRPFAPIAFGLQQPQAAVPNLEEGTKVNPYIMGTNRTTTLSLCADDEWDIENQPEGYDGVIYDVGWRYEAIGTEGVWVFTDTSATDRGWYATRYQTFYRKVTYNSKGILCAISVEYYGPIITDATFNAT